MKKTLYTLALVALISFASNAQDSKGAKKAPAAKETVNPDGTLQVAPADQVTPAAEPQTNSKDQKQQGGTRMAITEKGVPAAKKPAEKKAEPAKAEPVKTEKH